MRRLRRPTADERGTRSERRLLKDLEPRPRDLVAKDGRYVDLGWPRRRDAARDLVLARGDEVNGALLRRLEDFTPEVRLTALSSLVTRVHESELVIVAAVLGWDEPDARARAAKLLLERVDGDNAAATRILDAYALAEDGHPEVVFDDDWVRAVYGVVEPETGRTLLEAAADRSLGTQEPAPRAMQALQADRPLAVELCLERLERRTTDAPRTIGLLGALRSSEASEPLVAVLSDDDPRIRAAAAQALGHIQDPRAAPDLLARSADPVYEVRHAAQRALDALGSAGVLWGIAAAARGEPPIADGHALDEEQPVRQLPAEGPPPSLEPVDDGNRPPRPQPQPVSGLVPRLLRRLESGR